jgi:hypothetical protein
MGWNLSDFLWLIAVFGGLGAFIDFLIGRAGQERAKDFLLGWWVKLSDIKRGDLGKEDALFIASVIERWLGSTIWSRKRVMATSTFAVFSMILGTAVNVLHNDYTINVVHLTNLSLLLPTMWIEVLLLCVSISLLRILTINIANMCGSSRIRNVIIFLSFSMFYYVMLVVWPIITIATRHFLIALGIFSAVANIQLYLAGVKLTLFNAYSELHWSMFLPNELFNKIVSSYQLSVHELTNLSENARLEGAVLHFARFNMAFIPGLFRLTLSIIFLTSFLLRPLIMKPTLLIWARIVESDKPVFTLIFGGGAVVARVVGEIAKHF